MIPGVAFCFPNSLHALTWLPCVLQTCGTYTRPITCESEYYALVADRKCGSGTGYSCSRGDCCSYKSPCYGQWTSFSPCNRACGGGNSTRTYKVVNPARYGGQQCPHDDGYTEVEQCNMSPCPPGVSGYVHVSSMLCCNVPGLLKRLQVLLVAKYVFRLSRQSD